MSVVDDTALVLPVRTKVCAAANGDGEDRICSVTLEEIFAVIVVRANEVCHEFDQRSFQLLVQWQAGI